MNKVVSEKDNYRVRVGRLSNSQVLELDELISSLRATDNIKSQDMAEMKDLIVQKQYQISGLEARLRDHMEIDKNHTKQDNGQNDKDQQSSLQKQIDELKERQFRDSNHYEMQLQVKENVILI